jgi:FG-GAP repeat protein
MRFCTLRGRREAFLTAVLATACAIPEIAGASTRIFVPGDGIGTVGDSMGAAVALSGDTAAIGIPQGLLTPAAPPGVIAIFRNGSAGWQREAFLGPGLPSTFALQQDMLVVGGPVVATYVRSGSTWSRHDVLDTPTGSVALSGDTLVVSGTPATVYVRSAGTWIPQATLAGDQAGEILGNVAIDGDIAAVAGYVRPTMADEPYVHIYHRDGATWTLESTIAEPLIIFGTPLPSMAISGETVLIGTDHVDAYVRDQGTWSPQGTLDPLVPYFPSSFAIDGDRALIGSASDNIPGVDGAGSAYVFERSGGAWSRTSHLSDPDATPFAAFGASLAIEGDTLVVGSERATTAAGEAGYASVMDLATSPATKVATLDAGNAHAHENFGISFGASESTLVVAAPQAYITETLPSGAAYVFGATSGDWTLEAELHGYATASYGFGTSAAASTDAVVVGSPSDDNTGAAYVYTRNGGSWAEAARLAPDDADFDTFGQTVAFDGDRIAVGAPRVAGKVYLYTGSGASWPEEAVLVPTTSVNGDNFGGSLALAGNTLVAGASDASVGIEIAAGRAFVFVNDGSGWVQQAALESPSPIAYDGFGASVATRGETAVVGTLASPDGTKHFYVFERSDTTWTLTATFALDGDPSQSYLGSAAISSDENTIAIGMLTQQPGRGRVLTFVRDGGAWIPGSTLADEGPGNPGGIDGFGIALAFFGENLFVGATFDGAGGAVYEYGLGDSLFASGFDPAP